MKISSEKWDYLVETLLRFLKSKDVETWRTVILLDHRVDVSRRTYYDFREEVNKVMLQAEPYFFPRKRIV